MDLDDIILDEKLRASFTNEISGDVIEAGQSALEAMIGSSSLISKVPVLNYLHIIYCGAKQIRERHFLRKFQAFFYAFNLNDLSTDEINAFQEELNDPDHLRRVKEFIMIQLDRYYDETRSAYFGNLFSAYMQKKISWADLTNYSFILESLHSIAYKYLTFYLENDITYSHVIFPPGASYFYAAGMAQRHGSMTRLEEWVRPFYEFGIKKLKPETANLDKELDHLLRNHQAHLQRQKDQKKRTLRSTP